jgi:hypothetical protein
LDRREKIEIHHLFKFYTCEGTVEVGFTERNIWENVLQCLWQRMIKQFQYCFATLYINKFMGKVRNKRRARGEDLNKSNLLFCDAAPILCDKGIEIIRLGKVHEKPPLVGKLIPMLLCKEIDHLHHM